MLSVFGKEGTGTGAGSVIGGKGALDKINTEGMGRSRRQSFDGFDVRMERAHRRITAGARALRETADSMASADLVLTCAFVFMDCVLDKRDTYSNLSIDCHMPS